MLLNAKYACYEKNCKIFLNFDTTFNYIDYICSAKLI